ncbi:velvet factor [Gigaspora margarita]|uniref:Velvet factor n=1 Tax=Gigaspora margarita TaxID=4874 RepID=A0A8H4A6S7_GIGMA|nr:velvet factor [Gigaspora margarita]
MSSNDFSQIPRPSTRIQNQRSETSNSEGARAVEASRELQKSFFVDMQNIYTKQTGSSNGLPADWKFNLEIVQQPIRARACGYGNKDYRSISPPIFIKLNIDTASGPVNIENVDSQFFQLHASLYDLSFENCTTVWVRSSNPQLPQENILNLIGCRSEICHVFADEHGNKGLWFIYANLGIRTENDYFLRFQLFYLGWQSLLNTGSGQIKELAVVDSDKFKVFRNKLFPGVVECSQLTKCFVKQGANIPLRNEAEKFKNTAHSSGGELDIDTNNKSDDESDGSGKEKYNSYSIENIIN